MTQFQARRAAHVRVHHCTVFGAPLEPDVSAPILTSGRPSLNHALHQSRCGDTRRKHDGRLEASTPAADGWNPIRTRGTAHEPVHSMWDQSAPTPNFRRGGS